MRISRGKIATAQRIVLMGVEGIGKSTLASKFPDPVFIDTEGSTAFLDVARFDAPQSWNMLFQEVQYVIDNPDCCKTLVIDTADWAEKLCIEDILAKNHWDSIESPGYGKGYVYVKESFGKLLNKLSDVVGKGVNVVLTAHTQMRKFEQPDELGAYDRWELKLSRQTAPLVKEWADMLLFANYKTMVINVDNQGAAKGKNKARGGKRVLYTSHHPCWDAKNRCGMPEELPMEYDAIKPYIYSRQQHETPKTDPVRTDPEPVKQDTKPEPERTQEPPAKQKPAASDPLSQLRQLMENGMWSDQDIQKVVASHGYYPESVPINSYAPEFIEGALIGAWEQVEAALKAQLEQDIPF